MLNHSSSPEASIHKPARILTLFRQSCRQDDLEPMRLLGVGCRQKKVLLLSVQVSPGRPCRIATS